MATKESNKYVSEFMKHYINGLEECGYCPNPVPTTFIHSNADKHINMILLPEVFPGESIKTVQLTVDGYCAKTREIYEKDLLKQQKFLGPKMAKLPAETKKTVKDKIAIMNKVCGLDLTPIAKAKSKDKGLTRSK